MTLRSDLSFPSCLPRSFAASQEVLFPLFDTLSRDEEPLLRQNIAEQLKGIAEVCAQHSHQLQPQLHAAAPLAASVPASSSSSAAPDEGRRALFDIVLPVLARLLADPQAEVRIAAGESLVATAGRMRREDLGPRVLTIVLQLAHDDDLEDLRMTAAVLLNELAETLGPELCLQFVATEVICLAEDPVFRVRKAAALNLDAICRTAGPVHAARRLLPAFLRLTSDDIWGVRKACAESIVSVCRCLDPAVRVAELMPVFERLLVDPSKWVRNAAQQHLGPFLASLPGPRIAPQLLAHYSRMGMPPPGSDGASVGAAAAASAAAAGAATVAVAAASSGPTVGATTSNVAVAAAIAAPPPPPPPLTLVLPTRAGSDPAAESELASYCAYSFPAVALTLGRGRWAELRPLFFALSRDVQRKVRRPLAFALHELARILGPELAEQDLVPAFDLYLRDVDEVKAGAVRSLAPFLSALGPSRAREAYLPVLDELVRSAMPHNWRFRKMLASQLPALCQLFSPESMHEAIAPFALLLLADPVAEVREEAGGGVPALLTRIGGADAALQMELIRRLQMLGEAQSYRERLLFVHVCGAVGRSCDVNLFRRHFMAQLLARSGDPVRNVRRALAELLAPLADPLLILESQRDARAAAAAVAAALQEQRGSGAGELAEAEAAAAKLASLSLAVEVGAVAGAGAEAVPALMAAEAPIAPADALLKAPPRSPPRPAVLGSEVGLQALLHPSSPSAAAPHTGPSSSNSSAGANANAGGGGVGGVGVGASVAAAAAAALSAAAALVGGRSKLGAVAQAASSSSAPPAPAPSDGVGLDLEDDQFPMWAREDSEGLLPRALAALACDADAEVVRALGAAWVARHRPPELALPDVRQYIFEHARAPPPPPEGEAANALEGEEGVEGSPASEAKALVEGAAAGIAGSAGGEENGNEGGLGAIAAAAAALAGGWGDEAEEEGGEAADAAVPPAASAEPPAPLAFAASEAAT